MGFRQYPELRRADTQTPTGPTRLPLAFLARTPTRKRPCIRVCLKAFFRHASVFETHKASDIFFDIKTRVSTRVCPFLSGTKIASQNRSDHGGRRQARNHFAAEIAGFSASPAAKKSLATSDFGMQPQLTFKIAGKSPVLKGRDFLHPILPPSYRSQTSS